MQFCFPGWQRKLSTRWLSMVASTISGAPWWPYLRWVPDFRSWPYLRKVTIYDSYQTSFCSAEYCWCQLKRNPGSLDNALHQETRPMCRGADRGGSGGGSRKRKVCLSQYYLHYQMWVWFKCRLNLFALCFKVHHQPWDHGGRRLIRRFSTIQRELTSSINIFLKYIWAVV